MNRGRAIKKITAVGMILAIIALTGCGKEQADTQDKTSGETDETISVTASFYPIYALTSLITKGIDDITVSCVAQPSDECMRSYALSDWDAAIIASSSVVIIDGKGLESYSDALYQMGDTGPAVITTDYDQTLLTHDAILNPDAASTHYDGESPYLYMSTEGADSMLNAIASGLMVIDPDDSDALTMNLEDAHTEISALMEEIAKVRSAAEGTGVIVMNEALNYTCQELGLQIEAEYARETGDAFFDTELEECLQTLSACNSRIILIEKQVPKTFSDALASAGFTVIKLTTMSEIPASEGADGWFNAVRNNASEVLKGITNG